MELARDDGHLHFDPGTRNYIDFISRDLAAHLCEVRANKLKRGVWISI